MVMSSGVVLLCSFWCHCSIQYFLFSPMPLRCMMFKISSRIACPSPPPPPLPTVPSIRRAVSRRCGAAQYSPAMTRVSLDCAAESSRGLTL